MAEAPRIDVRRRTERQRMPIRVAGYGQGSVVPRWFSILLMILIVLLIPYARA
jgi:hypothetical protein